MLKTALFDYAINEKCCSVYGGRGICPLFSSPPWGIWQLKSPHPREFAIQVKKNANARGSARGGAGRNCNWLMHYLCFDWLASRAIVVFRVNRPIFCIFLAWKQINPESSSPRSWFSTVGWRPAWSLFDQIPFPASCSDALSFGCLFYHSSDPLVSGNLVLEDLLKKTTLWAKLSTQYLQQFSILNVESNPGLNWLCFTVLFDWPRKLAPPSQPIRCKLKPIAPWSLAFSRATGRLHAFTSSCHWLPLIISFTLIGRCDYFGFGFRQSIEKRSNSILT